VGAAEIACRTLSAEQQGLKSFMPGAGAGAAAGAGVAGALGAAAGAAAAIVDISATLKQYEDAQIALKEAAKEAAAEGLPGLAGRLSSLSKIAERRRSDAAANAVPGATAIAEGLGIAAVSRQSEALTNANPTTAGTPPGETPPSR
jgi:type VI secretion system secreted protein VgrG